MPIFDCQLTILNWEIEELRDFGPPWRGIAGTLSYFVKITISGDINALFENQVWAKGLGQGLRNVEWGLWPAMWNPLQGVPDESGNSTGSASASGSVSLRGIDSTNLRPARRA